MAETAISQEEKLKKEIADVDAGLKQMDTSLPPDQLYDELIRRVLKYHPSTDLSMIRKAYEIALQAHGDQRRLSGEPYIIHPLCVSIILAELELDKETIVSALLHDVLEDTLVSKEEMVKLFGEEVTEIVDGVTKLSQISYSADKVEEQAENLR